MSEHESIWTSTPEEKPLDPKAWSGSGEHPTYTAPWVEVVPSGSEESSH